MSERSTEWVSGTLEHTPDQSSISVSSVYSADPQTYMLFDHVTVRLSVRQSHSHANSLHFDLLRKERGAGATGVVGDLPSAKQGKAQIIKVSTACIQHRLVDISYFIHQIFVLKLGCNLFTHY